MEENILRSSHPVCPNDRQEIEEEGGFYADKAWARDILSLRIKCQQNSRGCEWIGQLRYAEEHQEVCPYEHVPCSACQGSIQRRLLGTHLTDECPKRIVECVYCQDEFFFIEKQPHEDIYCKRFPLVCENNCGHGEIPREEMASHVSEKCLMTVVLCPYSEAGCPFEDKRAYLEDHLEVSADGHLEMTWNSLILAKKEISTMKDKFYEVQEVNQEMKESVAECRSELRELSAAVNKLVKENVGQKKFNQVITEKIKIVEAKIPQKVTPEAYGIQVYESMRTSSRAGLGKTLTVDTSRNKLQKDALESQRKCVLSYRRLNNTD